MPLISVIIPVYNAENTIRETIESVLKQTFSDFELIVINDGSTDSTLDILCQIDDPRLKVYSYPNAGPNRSRNCGMSYACGKYVSFIDADDLWTGDKLEAQLRALEQNPEAAVAYSWTDCIDESGKFLRPGSHLTINGNVYEHLLLWDLLENGSNPLICREAFLEVGGFDELLPAGQDWDFYIRLAAKYEFVCVPSVQILYRVSGNSLSAQVFRLESALLQVIEKAFQQSPESLKYLKRYSLANIYKYLTYKALEGYEKRLSGFIGLKFLCFAIINEPSLLKRKSMILQLFIKSIVLIILPYKQAYVLLKKLSSLNKLHQLPNINNVLLGYTKIDPSHTKTIFKA